MIAHTRAVRRSVLGSLGLATMTLATMVAASGVAAQDDTSGVTIPEPPADPVPPVTPELPATFDVEATRAEHETEVQFCITRERSLRPDAVGRVEIAVSLDAAGHVTSASVASSTFAEPDTVVAECLASAVRRWAFVATGAVTDARLVVLLPPVPRVLAEPADEISLRWSLAAPSGASEGGRVGDEIREELERLRSRLTACVTSSEEARGASGELILRLVVPGGGDIGRDDVTWISGTFDDRHALVRCVRGALATIEARSSMRRRRFDWMMRWQVGRGVERP